MFTLLLLCVPIMAWSEEGKIGFHQHQWKHRLLVVSLSHEDWVDFQTVLKRERAGFVERRLLVYALVGEAEVFLVDPTASDVKAVGSAWGAKILNRLDQPTGLALLGLDGGRKAFYTWESFKVKDLYALIDSMPMRQQELEP
ncbi:MAG: DUF4174 domain-containing protein [Verrucomicrobiales bacterium]